MSFTTNLKSSSIFDHHHSNVSSNVLRDKRSNASDNLIVLDDDDDDDDTELHENEEHTTLKTLIPKLDIDTELIHVQPNLPMRICTAGLFYSNLPQTHVVIVNHSLVVSPKCIIKRQLYLSKPNPLLSLPIRTRIYNRYLSLSGFILEKPCAIKNSNRYLIIYDNFTAYYHSQTEFHLCLCQDFEKHLTNIDYLELRTYYRDAFRYSNQSKQSNLTIGTIIRVRKFGTQYHNARIVDKDCSIIKICFFERKSQTEMWIHLNSSIIEPTLTKELDISSSPTCQNSIKDLIISSNSDLLCLRKRKTNANDINEGTKKLRDRSNTQRLTMPQRQYSSSSDDTQPPVASSRANMLTVYYTSILLPKFRILNNIPYIVHNCSQQCILSVEKNFLPNKIHINPYLLPFECQWSIIDGKPRGYRTPCHRTFYSLDDIEKYLYRTDSQLSIKFFIDDLLTRFTPAIDTFDRKFIINNDLSNGQENILISVFNDIDNDKPDNFTYVTETHSFDNEIYAQYKDSSKTSCCNCTDNCNDRMKCACFRKTLKQAMLNHDPLVTEKQKNRYTLSNIIKSIGYQRKRLLNPVLSGIYECNSKCSCHSKHCSNRLVQQGLFVQLQLFKDKNKGWGLRTLHDIPRGTYICQYIGELITSDEGNDRAQTMDDRYQTSLDLVKQIRYEINNGEEYNDNDEDPYVIDGNLYANLGKYFNHSCEPNMYIQNVFIESHDLHFPNLALFTRTRVKAGEELTWHYNCELLPDREVKCFCGSKNCRGRLF